MLSRKKIQTKIDSLYDERTAITDDVKRFVNVEEIGILEFIVGDGAPMTGKKLKPPKNNEGIDILIAELKKDIADQISADPFGDNGEGYKAMIKLCEWAKGE